MTIYQAELFVGLFHHKPTRIGAKGAYHVVVGRGANAQLGIVHHALDRCVDLGRELHPHAHVDRSVLRIDSQSGCLLSQPVRPGPARCSNQIAGFNRLCSVQAKTIALTFDLLHPVLQRQNCSLLNQMMVEAIDNLPHGCSAQMSLSTTDKFYSVTARRLLELRQCSLVLSGVFLRSSEVGEGSIDAVDVLLYLYAVSTKTRRIATDLRRQVELPV